jgi:hypothetical protein
MKANLHWCFFAEVTDRLLFNNSGFEGGVLAWQRWERSCASDDCRGAGTRLGDVLHRPSSEPRWTAQAQEFL